MTKFTKEEQIQAIYDLKVGYTLGHADIAMLKAMARQLLAGLEQEPVGDVVAWHHPTEERTCDIRLRRHDLAPGPLYAAPQLPQPAVAENIALQNLRSAMEGIGHIRRTLEETFGGTYGTHVEPDVLVECKAICDAICAAYCGTAPQVTNVPGMAAVGEMPFLGNQEKAFVSGWNACRAAMLQGAEPVSQPDELPMDYLQGHKDGLEWAARLAEANHPQTGDWLYDDPLELAKAIRKGPDMPTAPVQGWIPCSERMPVENDIVLVVDDGYFVCEAQYREGDFFSAARGKGEFFETTCRDVELWMPLPAAPQQEADNG